MLKTIIATATAALASFVIVQPASADAQLNGLSRNGLARNGLTLNGQELNGRVLQGTATAAATFAIDGIELPPAQR
jgi:hypothetical protein